MGANQSIDSSVKQSQVDFFINGKVYRVNPREDRISPQSKLVDFIREKAGLTGTKYSCREGGCGSCVVVVKSKDPVTGQEITRSLNSCLIPVLSADGWDITTIEGLGDKHNGYDPIQEQVVKFNATQCGYCTPGMIMNFYGLKQNNPSFTMENVEESMDGNVCRCTGYRPILDAFKAMSTNAPEELKRKNVSRECPCGTRKSCCQKQESEGSTTTTVRQLYLDLSSEHKRIRVTTLDHLFEAIQHFTSKGINYKLVAGNTGTGVFKDDDNQFLGYIDINALPQLKAPQGASGTGQVEIGGGVTIASAINILQKASEQNGYAYLKQIGKHLKRVANTHVRNAGTLAGNLMLKHFHPEFPSDIFMLLDCVSAKLKIAASTTVMREYSMTEFRKTDMTGKVIISITFPPFKETEYYFNSFKVSRRYQNSHAFVNAAVLMKVDPKRNYSVRDKPSIVFGGIHPEFMHATGTEIYFVGKFLNEKTIFGAMASLEKEIIPSSGLMEGAPEYRKTLAQALLYKFILGVMKDVDPKFRSGAENIERFLTQGKQDFDASDQSQWPLYQPISKVEGKVQSSGEAEFVNDMEHRFGELFGCFVLTKVARAKIRKIDASEALMIPGVERFIQAKDIPGLNNAAIFYPEVEEIFVSKNVKYAGQPLGLILAETRDIAMMGATKVLVEYSDILPPILELKEALQQAKDEGRFDECLLEIRKTIEGPLPATNNISGEFQIGSQYHFHLETQTCLCIPKEDGMDVFAATQWPHGLQSNVAAALGLPSNSISVTVRRLGGAYGAKISKATHVATACAVAAQLTNRPVRIVLDIESNMKMIGKRLPYFTKYDVGTDDTGKILNLKCEIFCGPGCVGNEDTSLFAMINLQNCYRAIGWEVTPGKVITDIHPNTYCRSPGSTQGIAIIETIMEHIAFSLKRDPLEVRTANFIQNGDALFATPGLNFEGDDPLPKIIEELKSSADYAERKTFVDKFNENNRWKKRGLSIVPMRYPVHYLDMVIRYPVYVSVYAADGTVSVSHAGIEMGQGINTKCAQVVAHAFGISIEKVKVHPTNTLLSPNSGLTGGSVTSELICHAAIKCCEQLQAKMEPVRKKLGNPSWEELAMACYREHILLTAHHQDKLNDVKPYDIWGVTLTEVEVDVLTGEYKIVRVDLLEDAGKSLSPNVDIGQIEGAFVMGLGLWTTEKLVYDKTTGELVTCNSWNYKVPMPRDIPEDFRITMLRNRENPLGVLGSKATGESPLVMSVSVIFALRYALNSARKDFGNTDWFQMDAPVTPEDIQRYALTATDQFKL